MEKITLYIGLNDKDKKMQVIDTSTAINIITDLLFANGIDGATVYNARGIYKHDNGVVITENTIRCELFSPVENAVNGAIQAIKTALNQESIAKQTEIVTSEFV